MSKIREFYKNVAADMAPGSVVSDPDAAALSEVASYLDEESKDSAAEAQDDAPVSAGDGAAPQTSGADAKAAAKKMYEDEVARWSGKIATANEILDANIETPAHAAFFALYRKVKGLVNESVGRGDYYTARQVLRDKTGPAADALVKAAGSLLAAKKAPPAPAPTNDPGGTCEQPPEPATCEQPPEQTTSDSGTGGKPAPDPITGKFTFKMDDVKGPEFPKTSRLRGGVKFKTEITLELVSPGGGSPVKVGTTSDGGVKLDVDLAKQENVKIVGGIRLDELKEAFSFEISGKKIDIAGGVQFKIKSGLPFLAGIGEAKFQLIGAEWEKLAKNPDDFTLTGAVLEGGYQGEGVLPLKNGYSLKVNTKGVLSGSLAPNWPVLLGDAAKKAADKGAEEAAKQLARLAGQALTTDLAGVATSAAALALPAAAAAAIGYGMYQEAKNMKANAEAIQTAVAARKKAKEYAEGFARTITGGKGKGQGAEAAEAEIARIMSMSGATRDDVTAGVVEAQGGYEVIRARELQKLKDTMYAETVRIFEESHKDEFGAIENMGETWGFRGSFRKNLRMVLYADD